MFHPNPELIVALRSVAFKLEKGTRYEWGNMGRCNCGLLAQELSDVPGRDIHQMSLEKPGDWASHCLQYCPESGFDIDRLIFRLLSTGLVINDLVHLEKLDDPKILERMKLSRVGLRRNSREDLIAYLLTWARILEEQWVSSYPIGDRAFQVEVESTVDL